MCSLYHGTTVSADTSLINSLPCILLYVHKLQNAVLQMRTFSKGGFWWFCQVLLTSGYQFVPKIWLDTHTHTHDLSACVHAACCRCSRVCFFISVLLTLLVPFFLVVFFVSFLKLGPFKDAGGESFNNLLNNFFRYCIQHLLDTLLGLFTPGISWSI